MASIQELAISVTLSHTCGRHSSSLRQLGSCGGDLSLLRRGVHPVDGLALAEAAAGVEAEAAEEGVGGEALVVPDCELEALVTELGKALALVDEGVVPLRPRSLRHARLQLRLLPLVRVQVRLKESQPNVRDAGPGLGLTLT